ncbi:MAG TPA: hypothetical protein VGB43_07450 [Flavobacterium sp.]
MNKLILLAIAAFVGISCSDDKSETTPSSFKGELQWSKSYGGSLDEKISGSAATPDGGMLVIGYTESNDGDVIKSHAMLDIWLAKIDSNGNLEWNKTIGGSNDDYGMSINATNDGNFIIAGYTASNDEDVPGNTGMHDFYLTKINIGGDIIWSRNYGFMSHDHAHKIIATSDGGYFVAGYADYAGIDDNGAGNGGIGHEMKGSSLASNVQHGVGEFFGIKTDSNGILEWYRYFGGTMNDRVNDIVESDDGGFLMAGFTESNDFDVIGSKGSYDYWIIKLSHNGDLHWKNNYGGSGIDQAFTIAKTNNNSYLVTGRSNSSDGDISNPLGNFDAWVIHINDHGELLWNKSFGGPDFDVALSIKKFTNDNFVVVGNTRGSFEGSTVQGDNDFWLFEIDNMPNTAIHWQKTFGGSGIDIATDFAKTSNNSLMIVGESQSNDFDVPENKGGIDLWSIKLK